VHLIGFYYKNTREIFGTTENKKRLVSETGIVLGTG